MRIRLLAAALAATLALATPVIAHAEATSPAAPAAAAELRQDRPTDEVVRRGMDEIRATLEAALGAEGARAAGTLDASAHTALATSVEASLARILKETTLADKARKPLQVLFSDIIGGTELMKISPSPEIRRLAVIRVVQDLNRYGRQFDHPGWQPLAE